MGVATGCGCKEIYIDFLILLIPTPLVYICSFFYRASLLLVHFSKCFSFLFQYFFVITFYVLLDEEIRRRMPNRDLLLCAVRT